MLIEVRGAGCSGKTTVARKVMCRHAVCEPLHLAGPITYKSLKRGLLYWDGGRVSEFPEGARLARSPESDRLPFRRSQPIGYKLSSPVNARRSLVVLGHYESQCGGADNIPQIDLLYELVRRNSVSGVDVFCEGLLLGKCSPERLLAHRGKVLVIQLTTPPEECLRAMNLRRLTQGREPFTDEGKSYANLRSSYRGSMSSARRLAEAGIQVLHLTREGAPQEIIQRLGLAEAPETTLSELGLGAKASPAGPAQRGLFE